MHLTSMRMNTLVISNLSIVSAKFIASGPFTDMASIQVFQGNGKSTIINATKDQWAKKYSPTMQTSGKKVKIYPGKTKTTGKKQRKRRGKKTPEQLRAAKIKAVKRYRIYLKKIKIRRSKVAQKMELESKTLELVKLKKEMLLKKEARIQKEIQLAKRGLNWDRKLETILKKQLKKLEQGEARPKSVPKNNKRITRKIIKTMRMSLQNKISGKKLSPILLKNGKRMLKLLNHINQKLAYKKLEMSSKKVPASFAGDEKPLDLKTDL